MTKFNVGDEIKVTQNTSCIGDKNTAGWHVSGQGIVKIGAIGMIESVVGNLIEARFKEEDVEDGARGFSRKLRFDEIELVESKPTKNQRITALENEVAELKLIVHELRGKKSVEPSTTNTVEDIIEFEGQQYRKVDRQAREGDVVMQDVEHSAWMEKGHFYRVLSEGKVFIKKGVETLLYTGWNGRTVDTVNVYELMDSKPLTPNQQRAAIIEKAKKFVDELVKRGADEDAKTLEEIGNETYQRKFYIVEFKNKPNKVTALVRRANSLGVAQDVYPRHIGSAKCNPSDVFNKHIGKAIALGRALGLDVSEFEQAVQPNEVVVGHIIVWNESPNEPHKVVTKNGDWFDFIYLKDNKRYNNHEYCEIERFTKIIDDTNTKYEVSSNE